MVIKDFRNLMENFLGRYNDRGFSECDFAGTFFGT